ncbi:MAG: phosphoribosylformylglycinamidine cyclo-ligase [Dehalococcoidales bacterium]|nr:phosphoribosylformylglycinamidine cyclo-ligase [Dehalococcoidales bacterium]
MTNDNSFTYENAGVDRRTHGEITGELKNTLKMKDPRVLNTVGAFASLFRADFPGIEKPVLVLKAEEPGSKQYLASRFRKLDNIGFDMINHLINDIAVMGARPLAVLDVIVCGKIDKEDILKIVSAINQACENQDCVLIGGETSEQQGVVAEDVFILSSSVVGVVDEAKIIDGSRIKEGDKIIVLPSNGLMTNGYALVRILIKTVPAILEREIDGGSFIDAALRPHPAYYPYLKDILDNSGIHGLAHVTGDGISGNLKRIMPAGLCGEIDLGKIQILPIFRIIRETGNVPESDLLNNLNLGVGMILVTPAEQADSMIDHFREQGLNAYEIGDITSGQEPVRFYGKLVW